MSKNLDRRPILSNSAEFLCTNRSDTDLPQQMRCHLKAFIDGILANEIPVRLPSLPQRWVVQGCGHFHLVPELFLQVSGTTHFRFPHEAFELNRQQVLILPPRLLHVEHIEADSDTQPFSNVVIYADGTSLTCHLAREVEPATPGIEHLEARHHIQAPRIHDWLADACRLGWDEEVRGHGPRSNLASIQVRSLLATACAGVLRALDDAEAETKPEPPMIAKIRVWVQNQLGDHQLSVVRLAEQAGCTADYLSHVFSHTTGEHLAAFINRQRMDRAARLLAESTLTGKEVAWACGFSTQSYFIRTFHSHFGITPKTWRAKRRDDLGTLS